MQTDFLLKILKKSKENNLNTCIDTCGYAPQKTFKLLIPYTDLFFFDLKILNDKKHKKYTGVSNKIILENLKLLDKLNKNVIIRIPIIPTINDSNEDIYDFINFINKLENIKKTELLAYHSIANNKYKRYNKNNKLLDISEPSEKRMEEIKSIFKHNIK